MKLNLKFSQLPIVLPIFLCIIFWAFLAVLRDNCSLFGVDSTAFYHAGRSIFTNPSDVYNSGYFYLPFFAILIYPITLLPFGLYEWVLLFVLLFFSGYSVVLLNRILILKNINNKFIRFLFLLVVFNGHAWFQQFDLLNVKTIVLFFLLLLIERELKVRESKTTLDYKFLSIQFCIFSIILSILPYFIFIIPIYLLHANSIRDVIKKIQLKKYALFIIIFIGCNFFFIIYPYLIIDFLKGLTFSRYYPLDIYTLTPEIIINNDLSISSNFLIGIMSILKIDVSVSLVSIALSSLFTLIIIVRYEDISIERKLGLFCLFSVLFSSYIRTSSHVITLPIIILMFVDHEKISSLKNHNIFLFIKENIVLVLGMTIVSLLMFLPDLEFMYRMFKILRYIPIKLTIFTWSILYCCLWMAIYFFNKKGNINVLSNGL